MDFAVPVAQRFRIKESEKIQKYLNLNRELKKKKLWNVRVTVIPVAAGTLGRVSKVLERRLLELKIRGRIETIQTAALLRSASILRRVLET